jgi:hypothetical protein
VTRTSKKVVSSDMVDRLALKEQGRIEARARAGQVGGDAAASAEIKAPLSSMIMQNTGTPTKVARRGASAKSSTAKSDGMVVDNDIGNHKKTSIDALDFDFIMWGNSQKVQLAGVWTSVVELFGVVSVSLQTRCFGTYSQSLSIFDLRLSTSSHELKFSGRSFG